MIRRIILALLLVSAPSLARAQSYGSPTFTTVKIGGANGQTITGIGTVAGTVAAGNDSRILGAVQSGSAAALASLTLGTPLAIAQGGCGANTALGCLTNLGLVGGTAGYVLTSTGPGSVPSFQAVSSGSANAVLYTAQSLTAGQQDQVRANISGPISSAPSAATTLATTDFDRPLFPTGAVTITAANGGAGWRTGPVANSNTVTGLVTLAVPSGATLDGVTNGTTILYPYQRARLVQTGATAYATAYDGEGRAPIVAQVTLTSAVASLDINLPAGYSRFRIEGSNVVQTTSGGSIQYRVSNSGAAGIKSGAADYSTLGMLSNGGTPAGSTNSNQAQALITGSSNANNVFGAQFTGLFNPGTGSTVPTMTTEAWYQDTTPSLYVAKFGSVYQGNTSGSIGRANLIRLLTPTGTFAAGATVTVWGEP